MSLKETYKHLKDLLTHIHADLDKSENGNKAASQRVRTGTVKLEKIAKLFRKESIQNEKKTKGQKKPAKTAAKKTASHSGASKASKGASKAKAASKSKSASVKAKPKAKAVHHAKARHLSVKKATAKLPTKKVHHR